MAKPDKNPRKSKTGKAEPLKPKVTAGSGGQPLDVVEGKAMTTQPVESGQADVILISREKFQEKVQALHGLTTIKNDKDMEVAFDGEAKDAFIAALKDGYPIIQRALGSIYELGNFLFDVREKLKPHKLYYSWLDYAGIPERTASNYVQVYERYADKLPQFAHLGIKKLLTASRLPNCADYVEEHEQAIAEQSSDELNKAVKALRSTKKTTETGRGRRPTWIPVGDCKIRPSMDGTKLVIEGIAKEKQAKLIEEIKILLS